MKFLLDTCILSKLRRIKQNPNKNLETWIEKHSEQAYFISALTIGEIQKGISNVSSKNEPTKKMIFEDWLLNEIIPRFKGRILNFDIDVAFTWGQIVGENHAVGKNISITDSLIAATALTHNCILVTENVLDFECVNIPIINPCLFSRSS